MKEFYDWLSERNDENALFYATCTNDEIITVWIEQLYRMIKDNHYSPILEKTGSPRYQKMIMDLKKVFYQYSSGKNPFQ